MEVTLQHNLTNTDSISISKRRKPKSGAVGINDSFASTYTPINNLDDGCLMHIFSFLSPIPDRYNTALVCHRWHYLACHPRLWLRVDRSVKDASEPGVFPDIESAVAAARPGDTILISVGGSHLASNIQIRKPLCLIGGGEVPDETMLVCSRGSDSALEFLSTCKIANLTVKAELGCCLLHRKGRLTIDGCVLQCETNPLDYLSCPIVSTAGGSKVIPSLIKCNGDGVSVSHTRIEGGAKAVSTSGDLALQHVRVIYTRTSLFFWFDVECQYGFCGCTASLQLPLNVHCNVLMSVLEIGDCSNKGYLKFQVFLRGIIMAKVIRVNLCKRHLNNILKWMMTISMTLPTNT